MRLPTSRPRTRRSERSPPGQARQIVHAIHLVEAGGIDEYPELRRNPEPSFRRDAHHSQGQRVLAGGRKQGKRPLGGLQSRGDASTAAGACMTSSLGLVAENSDVVLNDVVVSVAGTRQSKPPRLVSAQIDIGIASPAQDDKLDRIVDIARRASTVVSTLQEAVDLQVTWKRLEKA
ncbi:MAG: OsmC family protein [Trueperaceae bacterium]|nr:OsmC family protein [Trueperaceae bacterium]